MKALDIRRCLNTGRSVLQLNVGVEGGNADAPLLRERSPNAGFALGAAAATTPTAWVGVWISEGVRVSVSARGVCMNVCLVKLHSSCFVTALSFDFSSYYVECNSIPRNMYGNTFPSLCCRSAKS